MTSTPRTAFVTGTAGFIGFHLARLLLGRGWRVRGYDGMTDYYDVRLKARRHAILAADPGFAATEGRLEDAGALDAAMDAAAPDVVVHLAGQAGVRHSLEHPRAYLDSNVIGTFNVMEGARRHAVDHLLMASTSSVYGANAEMPFAETHKADRPLTIYAATKAANEAMAHAWAHVHGVPTTMFRFFTVYGPWGRPDMAYFKFAQAIVEGRPIDLYNGGDMHRDFTYVDDLVRGIAGLIDAVPTAPGDRAEQGGGVAGDSLSPAAPYRVVNIGTSAKVRLMDLVEALEAELGPVEKRLLPMQTGDVPATWADATLLRRLTGDAPRTPLRDGVAAFAAWYRDWRAGTA